MLGRGRDVDRSIPGAGRHEHLQVRQLLEYGARERRAFAHDADDLEVAQPCDEVCRVGDVIVEDRKVGARRQCAPVGHRSGDVLIVVEYRDLGHGVSPFDFLVAAPERPPFSHTAG